MTTPITTFCDRLLDQSLERHAWISRFAAQIAIWKAEDTLNGNPWGQDEIQPREPVHANNVPGSNHG